MSIKLDSPAEAILAIATVAVGADGVGSISERDFLFKQVKGMDVFEGQSPADFAKLLGAVTERVYASLPMEDAEITAKGLQMLVAAARSVLTPELQRAAVKMANELSASDGVSAKERGLLQELEKGFASR
jgi:hypothetical protein